MSQQQRTAVDNQLRSAGLDTSRPIAEQRESFAALMAGPAPSGVSLAGTTLGGRPALELTPDGDRAGGTILYFHGGSWRAWTRCSPRPRWTS